MRGREKGWMSSDENTKEKGRRSSADDGRGEEARDAGEMTVVKGRGTGAGWPMVGSAKRESEKGWKGAGGTDPSGVVAAAPGKGSREKTRGRVT